MTAPTPSQIKAGVIAEARDNQVEGRQQGIALKTIIQTNVSPAKLNIQFSLHFLCD
jgi:hypothetical protein